MPASSDLAELSTVRSQLEELARGAGAVVRTAPGARPLSGAPALK